MKDTVNNFLRLFERLLDNLPEHDFFNAGGDIYRVEPENRRIVILCDDGLDVEIKFLPCGDAR